MSGRPITIKPAYSLKWDSSTGPRSLVRTSYCVTVNFIIFLSCCAIQFGPKVKLLLNWIGFHLIVDQVGEVNSRQGPLYTLISRQPDQNPFYFLFDKLQLPARAFFSLHALPTTLHILQLLHSSTTFNFAHNHSKDYLEEGIVDSSAVGTNT